VGENVATPAKFAKREDKLPLERALSALEDVHQSLNEFSKADSAAKNDEFATALKSFRHKAKKLRKRAKVLAGLWDRTFEMNSSGAYPPRRHRQQPAHRL
jgi:aminoglycoside phosphotransferase (APT) family kinase protein